MTMLPGYNHNVKYKGMIFHIQTEDSGVKNPHIITLLFLGGNIIARKKVSYADIIKHERLQDVVRELMQEQHKQMLRELKDGKFDNHPLVVAEMEKRGIKVPTAPPMEKEAPPPPPPPVSEIPEKPAQKTIELQEGKELSDEEIFGADIISDKSLDEVILSFLAKQLEEEEKK